jgi:hypothetical protein
MNHLSACLKFLNAAFDRLRHDRAVITLYARGLDF